MLPPPSPFEPPFAIRVALAALEAWANLTKPPAPPSWPGEHVKSPLPAVEFPKNRINDNPALISEIVTKFCASPELFPIPAPLMVNVNVEATVIVNALAPGLNAMPFTSVFAEKETLVVSEAANVAISEGPLGIVGGVE